MSTGGDALPGGSRCYIVAERFKSVQGEGMYAGVPMAFIRFAGCSVGKKVCSACDTDFERVHAWHGGGVYTRARLMNWASDQRHVCLTGGEPLDQEGMVEDFLTHDQDGMMYHLETSGTRELPKLTSWERQNLWVCVSPKPGFRQDVLEAADEIKVIVPGLGVGEGWPQLEEVLEWTRRWPKKPIFLQPRNAKHEVDKGNLALCEQLVLEHPELRLSVQLHKVLSVR